MAKGGTNISIILAITSAEIGADRVHDLTLDLCRSLGQENDIDAKLAEGKSEAGSKGDPITVGTIILALITGGAVNSLINVLKSYSERVPSLEMNLKREDGASLKILAKNLSQEQIERTISKTKEFFGGAG